MTNCGEMNTEQYKFHVALFSEHITCTYYTLHNVYALKSNR